MTTKGTFFGVDRANGPDQTHARLQNQWFCLDTLEGREKYQAALRRSMAYASAYEQLQDSQLRANLYKGLL